LARAGGIRGQDDGAEARDRVKRDRVLGEVRRAERNDVPRAYSARPEARGRAPHALAELAVRQRSTRDAVRERRFARPRSRGSENELRQRDVRNFDVRSRAAEDHRRLRERRGMQVRLRRRSAL
jgi:hypothetical protein